MIIYLSKEDWQITLRSTKIDLRALIEIAGHENAPFFGDGMTQVPIEALLAQQQTSYEHYWNMIPMMSPRVARPLYLQLLNKSIAHDVLKTLNLNLLNTKNVTCRKDIEDFEDDIVILKPSTGMNSTADYKFAYTVMSKIDLLSHIDSSDIDFTTQSFIIQEGVTNSHPIIWIGGYVNPNGDIHIDGILNQTFSIHSQFLEDQLRYPERYKTLIEEVPISEATALHQESIRQIQLVLEHFEAKSTPFCIQCIVDDDNQVQLLDFNFGFGKAYALSNRRYDQQYILDRIKYTYGGAESIPANNTYMMNCYALTPNGVTDEIKEYIDNCAITIILGLGQPDKDYTLPHPDKPINVYHRNESRFVFVGSSREEVVSEIEKFKTFLTTL